MKYLACYYDIDGKHPDRKEYFEIGEDNFVVRQVYVFPFAVVTSRVDYDPLVGGTLCDQSTLGWDEEGLVEISPEEFEAAWNLPDPRMAPK